MIWNLIKTEATNRFKLQELVEQGFKTYNDRNKGFTFVSKNSITQVLYFADPDGNGIEI
jgi:catechol-2,3-dioxygenase